MDFYGSGSVKTIRGFQPNPEYTNHESACRNCGNGDHYDDDDFYDDDFGDDKDEDYGYDDDVNYIDDNDDDKDDNDEY